MINNGEWRPISEAPMGVCVECGGWEAQKDGTLQWKTAVAVAWLKGIFGTRWGRAEFGACRYSHFRPLPPPPKGDAND